MKAVGGAQRVSVQATCLVPLVKERLGESISLHFRHGKLVQCGEVTGPSAKTQNACGDQFAFFAGNILREGNKLGDRGVAVADNDGLACFGVVNLGAQPVLEFCNIDRAHKATSLWLL